MMHLKIPISSLRKLIKKLPQNQDLSVLHLPGDVMKTADVFDTLDLLNAVDDIVDTLPNLRVFGVHGLQLRAAHVPVLSRMLGVLRDKLTGLSFSLEDWDFEQFHGQRFLLEAICKLRKLDMLAFPQFEAFVQGSTNFLQWSATLQQCTVLVGGEPSQEHMAAVSAVAPNLTILPAPFEC
jgi:hypothetical protein